MACQAWHGGVAGATERRQCLSLLCKPGRADRGKYSTDLCMRPRMLPMSLSVLGAGQGLQIVGLAALLIRLSLWLGLLSHRRRLSSDNCEVSTLPIEARA